MARPARPGAGLSFAASIVVPFLRVFTKRQYDGQHHIPAQGGVIIAANHLSHFDPLPFALFVWQTGRLPRFLAKAELFRVPALGLLLRSCGQIPVHRGTSDAARALGDAVLALEHGEAVMVYPEGTLTRDPQLWPMAAKTGTARLALASGAPVIPVAHWGSQQILAPYSKRFRLLPRKTVRAVAGPPVDLSAWRGQEPTAAVLREMTEAIMRDVTALLGQLRGEQPPAEPFRRPLPGERKGERKRERKTA